MINKIPRIACLLYCISLCPFIAPLYSDNLGNKLPHIEEYQLDNGMRVLISHNYDNPVVYVNVNINASKLDDPVKQPNLSQKAFYLIGEGTSKYPSIDHIRDKLFSIGSDDGRFKRFNITNFNGKIEDYFLKKDLNEGLELISEVIIHPTYPIFFKNFLKSIVFRFSPKTSLIRNRNLIRSHRLHQYANIYSHIHPKSSLKYGKKDLIKLHDNHFRHENITKDYVIALTKVGVKNPRSLPVANKTIGKKKDLSEYYTEEIKQQAICVFGPFLEKYNYSFPENWGMIKVPYLSICKFKIFGVLRKINEKYFKTHPKQKSIKGSIYGDMQREKG